MTNEYTHPKVLQGKNGYLFLRNDANDVIGQICGKRELTADHLEIWKRVIEARLAHAKAFAYTYKYLIIPNKHCIYPEFLPDGITVSMKRSAIQLTQLSDIFTYPLDFLNGYKHKNIYHLNDTHWTQLGAVLTLNKFMEDISPYRILFREYKKLIHGDLGTKLIPEITSESSCISFERKSSIIYDNRIHNIGRVIETVTNNNALPTACVFGDSFLTGTIHLLGEYFSRLYYFHAPVFDKDVIELIRPDIVISANVERFFTLPRIIDFSGITYKKCFQSGLAGRKELLNINNYSDGLTGIDYNLIHGVLKSTASCRSDSQFNNIVYKTLFNTTLEKFIPSLNRRFIGTPITSDLGPAYTGWGCAFLNPMEETIKGLSIWLQNLYANGMLILKIYPFRIRRKLIDTSAIKPVFEKRYLISELTVYADIQEVYLPITGLHLDPGNLYFFTVEGDSALGCGQTNSDLSEELYAFRGYAQREHATEFHALAYPQAIAFQIHHEELPFAIPTGHEAAIKASMASCSGSYAQLVSSLAETNPIWLLARKCMDYTGRLFYASDKAPFTGWGIGYLHLAPVNPAGFSAVLGNIKKNDFFCLRIYFVSENKAELDACNLPIAFCKTYHKKNLLLYADEQEVFFPTPGINLNLNTCYLVTIEGTNFLHMGTSVKTLGLENYLFRGYVKTKKNHTYKSIKGTESCAIKPCFSKADNGALGVLLQYPAALDNISQHKYENIYPFSTLHSINSIYHITDKNIFSGWCWAVYMPRGVKYNYLAIYLSNLMFIDAIDLRIYRCPLPLSCYKGPEDAELIWKCRFDIDDLSIYANSQTVFLPFAEAPLEEGQFYFLEAAAPFLGCGTSSMPLFSCRTAYRLPAFYRKASDKEWISLIPTRSPAFAIFNDFATRLNMFNAPAGLPSLSQICAKNPRASDTAIQLYNNLSVAHNYLIIQDIISYYANVADIRSCIHSRFMSVWM